MPHLDIDVVGPAGAIGSTAADMARWLQMVVASGGQEDRAFLTREQFDFLTHPQVVVRPTPPLFYGIGWEVEWKNGLRSIGHGGGIVGQNGYVRAVPEAGFGIVLLSNQQSDFDDLLVRYAEDLFVHDALERDAEKEASLVAVREQGDLRKQAALQRTTDLDPNGELPPAHGAEAYAGTYRNETFGTIEIETTNGGLHFAFNVFEGPVKHEEGESFLAFIDPNDGSSAFGFTALTGADQEVLGIRMSMQGGAPEVVFTRWNDDEQETDPRSTQVAAFVEETMERHGIPGVAVAVLRNGELVHRTFHGFVDAENGIRTSKEHLFRIYSLTKLFSATAVFQLIQEGKLALDDPIGLYLEGLPPAWQAVRIEHLLSHSSGLPDIVSLVDREEAEARALVYAEPIAFSPGQRYSYNQTNFWLLQRLVETLAGESFQAFVLGKQLPDAGETALFSTDRRRTPPDASGEFFPFPPPQEQPFGYLDASNGLVLSLDAFVDWSLRLEEGDLLDEATKREMWRRFPFVEDKAFAHGWDIHDATEPPRTASPDPSSPPTEPFRPRPSPSSSWGTASRSSSTSRTSSTRSPTSTSEPSRGRSSEAAGARRACSGRVRSQTSRASFSPGRTPSRPRRPWHPRRRQSPPRPSALAGRSPSPAPRRSGSCRSTQASRRRRYPS